MLNKLAFLFNFIYNIPLKCTNYSIISYNSFLLESKIRSIRRSSIKTKNPLNNGYNIFFKSFYIEITYSIQEAFKQLSNLDYLIFQHYTIFNIVELEEMNNLKKYIWYLLKLLFYYLGDVFKLIGINNIEISNQLQLHFNLWGEFYNIKYNEIKLIETEYLEKISIFILNIHFIKHYKLLEQMYLYSGLLHFDKYKNIYINTNNILLKKYMPIHIRYIKKYINHIEVEHRFMVPVNY